MFILQYSLVHKIYITNTWVITLLREMFKENVNFDQIPLLNLGCSWDMFTDTY